MEKNLEKFEIDNKKELIDILGLIAEHRDIKAENFDSINNAIENIKDSA